MEMAFHPQGPLCRRGTPLECAGFAVRAIPGPFPQASLRFQEIKVTGARFKDLLVAGAGYSTRKSRREVVSRAKGSSRKQSTRRTQVETSSPRKDQTDEEEKQVPETSGSNEPEALAIGSIERISFSEVLKAGSDSVSSTTAVKQALHTLEEAKDNNQEDFPTPNQKAFAKWPSDDGDNVEADRNRIEQSNEVRREGEGDGPNPRAQKSSDFVGEEIGYVTTSGELNEQDKQEVYVNEKHSNFIHSDKEEELIMSDTDLDAGEIEEPTQSHDNHESAMQHGPFLKAQDHKRLLENLAEDNFSRGNKLFIFPEVVNPCQVVQVYLNRSLSTLVKESDVLIKGSFNGRNLKLFTKRMRKTDIYGDWWSCQLSVPEGAHRIDFVFFNGQYVYENNNSNSFFVPVKGGVDEGNIADLVLEQKHKELEKLVTEKSERERRLEEQQLKEAEQAASGAHKAQAKAEVEKKRLMLYNVLRLAAQSSDQVLQIEPSLFKGGDKVRIYYNISSRQLAHATEIWIHGGHNNWNDGLSIVKQLICSEKADGNWWYADVIIPDLALVLDFVFADGSPGKAAVYDNNNGKDFHVAVPQRMSEELFWVEEEHRIYMRLQDSRRIKENAQREKTKRAESIKTERKEGTKKMFLLSQKHIVYTEPPEVKAGTIVTVIYNPSNTVLNGLPEVWFRCSFNHWTHRDGPLKPQKMVPADTDSYLKATVKVPLDAYMMDFAFSEREDGGLCDDRNGVDYHIPVAGGIAKEPPMHIVHIAVEMAPIAKVGGLGDVVTSLCRAVQDLGHTVEIILPKYDCMNLSNVKDLHYIQSFAWGGTEISVWLGEVTGLSVYFLEPQNGMFWVGCIYGRNDAHRFGFFCHAALEFLLQSGSQPDILHCHDWSSAPVAWLYKEHYRLYGLGSARVIFTIHNLEFGVHQIGRAMSQADKATTVSPKYSKEVAGHHAISPHLCKFHGILNGIDPMIWDPYNDNFIPAPYTPENVVEGKRAAKESLQQRFGLKRSDQPLVGVITRLTGQKGIHLIKHAISRAIECNGQIVLLGSAPDPRIQHEFVNLGNQLHSSHGDSVHLCLTYDEPLSHLIYAGADFILVPSLFEPCGLTQLIAMRYGSIPIVRKTGGLHDTVFDVHHDKERASAHGLEPNGFCFDGVDPGALDSALNRAFSAWHGQREWFNSLRKLVMEQDWSWNRPALDYIELYHAARK